MLALHLFLLIATVFYLVSSHKDPGYLRGLEIEEFARTLSRAIVEGRNINYFCFTCRGLFTPTMWHCPICERCVESFDHHCQIIDNCIGGKNHCSFLGFILTAFFYTIIQVFACIYLLQMLIDCEFGFAPDTPEVKEMCPPYNSRTDDVTRLVLLVAYGLFSLFSLFQIIPVLCQMINQFESLRQNKIGEPTSEHFEKVFDNSMAASNFDSITSMRSRLPGEQKMKNSQ